MRESCTAQSAVLRAERLTNGKLTAAGGMAARHEGALRAPLEINARLRTRNQRWLKRSSVDLVLYSTPPGVSLGPQCFLFFSPFDHFSQDNGSLFSLMFSALVHIYFLARRSSIGLREGLYQA